MRVINDTLALGEQKTDEMGNFLRFRTALRIKHNGDVAMRNAESAAPRLRYTADHGGESLTGLIGFSAR